MTVAKKNGKKKHRLSVELAAALASGAQVEGVELPKVDETETPKGDTDTDTDTDTDLTHKPVVENDPENPGNVEVEQAAADLVAANTKVTELNEQVTSLNSKITDLNSQIVTQKGVTEHIQTQLTAANASLAKAQVDLENEKKKLEDQQKGNTELRAIVLQATQRLGIAMNTQIAGLETMSDTNLVAQFSKLNSDFEKKFHVGPKASGESDVSNENRSNASVDSVATAATRSTTIPRKQR